jgi:serine phosphatase RsbU (regulator of sigma subunit)
MSDAPPTDRDDDTESTRVFSATSARAQLRTLPPIDWVHSLRVVAGAAIGQRFRVGDDLLTVGRRADNAIILPDPEVSSLHCSVRALPGTDALEVTDHQSTNGTFINGRRVRAVARLPDRSVLQAGSHVLLHEFRSRQDMELAEQSDRDLARARHYVESLLPPPITEGPVRTEWFFRPSAMLGGDAFGLLDLGAGRFAGYVIDVSGHGAGAAMHTVSVISVLRQRALPETDLTDPAQVLTRLNAMFQMDTHDGLFFTMWYGVYDIQTRDLVYASAGHHPAYLRGPVGESAPGAAQGGARPLRPLVTRSLAIGAAPESAYRDERLVTAPGERLYLFSDGLFEVACADGRLWALGDLLPHIEQSDPGPGEPERLYRAVRKATGDGPLEDDCSIVTVTFL